MQEKGGNQPKLYRHAVYQHRLWPEPPGSHPLCRLVPRHEHCVENNSSGWGVMVTVWLDLIAVRGF